MYVPISTSIGDLVVRVQCGGGDILFLIILVWLVPGINIQPWQSNFIQVGRQHVALSPGNQ